LVNAQKADTCSMSVPVWSEVFAVSEEEVRLVIRDGDDVDFESYAGGPVSLSLEFSWALGEMVASLDVAADSVKAAIDPCRED
jgi:hypothetical protein